MCVINNISNTRYPPIYKTEKMKDIAIEIVENINKTTNDYDAVDETIKVLMGYFSNNTNPNKNEKTN